MSATIKQPKGCIHVRWHVALRPNISIWQKSVTSPPNPVNTTRNCNGRVVDSYAVFWSFFTLWINFETQPFTGNGIQKGQRRSDKREAARPCRAMALSWNKSAKAYRTDIKSWEFYSNMTCELGTRLHVTTSTDCAPPFAEAFALWFGVQVDVLARQKQENEPRQRPTAKPMSYTYVCISVPRTSKWINQENHLPIPKRQVFVVDGIAIIWCENTTSSPLSSASSFLFFPPPGPSLLLAKRMQQMFPKLHPLFLRWRQLKYAN